jgi:hypothetical protein
MHTLRLDPTTDERPKAPVREGAVWAFDLSVEKL